MGKQRDKDLETVRAALAAIAAYKLKTPPQRRGLASVEEYWNGLPTFGRLWTAWHGPRRTWATEKTCLDSVIERLRKLEWRLNQQQDGTDEETE